ncbi:MAG: FtsX-like permease family protein [Xanthomonadales bacterium]|nr:FtsX-like permease family protein [Xanthomonadales bacterium]
MKSTRSLLRLSFRQLLRDLASGELRVLFAALALAVLAVTAVGFVTDRATRALALEANRLLGGDAVLRSDSAIAPALRAAAQSPGLAHSEVWTFNSMLRAGPALKLGEVRALGADYPLRGEYRLRDEHGNERGHRGAPDTGTIWLSRAGADALGVQIGDRIFLGRSELQIAALVVQEPDAVLDYFNTAPKVFVALTDLDATGLIQPGARITYRLVVAGDTGAVDAFVDTLKPQLGRGQRIETAADARPEVRNALDRADRFLGLAALVSVVLASVAVAMAARRHTARHLDDAAVLRCLGASQREIASLHLLALLLLTVLASVLGIALAYALQSFAGDSLERTLGIDVPAAGPLPALYGAAVGFTVLISFALPPVLALRRVPALRVLRRDIPLTETSALVTTVVGLSGLVALLWWKSGSAELATSLLGGLVLAFIALALLASLLIFALRHLRQRLRGAWRYGLANLSRRAASSLAQIAALGLGLTVLLLLGLVRSDLLARWREAIPADAPNQFVVNIQQDQLEGVRALLAEQGLPEAQLFPLVRGRLAAVNGAAFDQEAMAALEERQRRRAEREFNLSATAQFADDNVATAGRLWTVSDADRAQWSVEEGFAKSLGWQVGDVVAFDVGGQRVEAPITSLRSVDWESFRPNFFVIGTPATVAKLPASYITSLHLPELKRGAVNALVERFPNLSVIDIGAVLAQVKGTIDQVTEVVELVFLFTLAAGVLVLVAAIHATQDERLREGAVMRVLGARRAQLRFAQLSEFLVIGVIAAFVAVIAANGIAGSIATRVFDLPWAPNLRLSLEVAATGIALVVLAGWFTTRRTVAAPPSETLRALG